MATGSIGGLAMHQQRGAREEYTQDAVIFAHQKYAAEKGWVYIVNNWKKLSNKIWMALDYT